MNSKILLSFIMGIVLCFNISAQLTQRVNYATYIGGSGWDGASIMDIDAEDNSYLVLFAGDGCITTEGVHQQNYGGGDYDVLLQKRDKNGNLIWSTYYGGSGSDEGYFIKLLKSGKIAIVGYTDSRDGIDKNGRQSTYGGGEYDGFLAVFNEDGTLDWATYIGNSGYDGANVVVIDSEGFIYVSGSTNSTNGISTPGTYQVSNRGNYDGFLSKYSTDGNLIWCTYLGGTNTDFVYAINIDSEDKVWIGGLTYSTSFITTSNAFSISNKGSGDGFLMAFDKNGNKLYGTYYGGSNRDDINVIHIDKYDNIWFGGPTKSNTDIATSDAIKPFNSGLEDVFLVKFNKDKQREWATYLGGSEWDTFFGMDTDKNGNVILSMMTKSEDFVPIDIDHAMQPVYGGGPWDAVYSKIDPDGNLIWSTFHGGEGDDRGLDIKVNSDNNLVFFTTTSSLRLHTDDADDTTLDGELDALLVILKEVDISKTIESSKEIFTFNILPNPAVDRLTIDMLNIDRYRVDIFDNLGKAMHDFTQEANSIDVRNMASGLYFIQLTDVVTGNVARNSFVKI